MSELQFVCSDTADKEFLIEKKKTEFTYWNFLCEEVVTKQKRHITWGIFRGQHKWD